jgi:hypothetical protein
MVLNVRLGITIERLASYHLLLLLEELRISALSILNHHFSIILEPLLVSFLCWLLVDTISFADVHLN